ncbi:hypothetical protein GCM10027028_65180 [Streptomyces sundarbansensis]
MVASASASEQAVARFLREGAGCDVVLVVVSATRLPRILPCRYDLTPAQRNSGLAAGEIWLSGVPEPLAVSPAAL